MIGPGDNSLRLKKFEVARGVETEAVFSSRLAAGQRWKCFPHPETDTPFVQAVCKIYVEENRGREQRHRELQALT